MNTSPMNTDVRKRMQELKCCILIPTYNNASTLGAVVRDAMLFAHDVIVVNDGSTDATKEILNDFKDIIVIHFDSNKGKGAAMKAGFRLALQKGFHYAVTLDSDRQHSLSDIPVFLDELERSPGSLIIGKRNMTAENKPKKNTFANRFSNFWFRVETGRKAPDTQSGFRLYPLDHAGRMKFFTRRYEFEVEVLVRCAWRDVEIRSVPIQVWYAPGDERVSHFRPFRDFARISLLNTVLVIIALLWIKPFRFMKSLNRKNIREFFVRHVLSPDESNFRKALSVAIGTFMGIIPIWGWQIAASIAVSYIFKLNKMMTIVSSNISIPPMIPVIVYGSYEFGGLFITKNAIDLPYDPDITLGDISINFLQYLVGSVALAIVAGLLFGLITYILLSIFRKGYNKPESKERSSSEETE